MAAKRKPQFTGFKLGVFILLLIALPITLAAFATETQLRNSAKSYPIKLTGKNVEVNDDQHLGVHYTWSPSKPLDFQSSLFIWRGTDCRSFASGYKSGELLWSQGLNQKVTKFTYWNETLQHGQKLCAQIWLDFYGGVIGSNPVVLTVKELPKVVIMFPERNSKVKAGSTIHLQATVTSKSGVSSVEFSANKKVICKITKTPYTCRWKVPSGSKYAVSAKATNTVGGTNTVTNSFTIVK